MTSLSNSRYFFAFFPNSSHRLAWPNFLISFDLNLANSPVNLNILINESLANVLFFVFYIYPIFSSAYSKNSSSVIVSKSISSNKSYLGSCWATVVFSSMTTSCIVIASLSFCKLTIKDLPLPFTFKVMLFSSLPVSMLSAFNIWSFDSSIFVASEYSTMSTSASPFSILSYISLRIDLDLRISSINDMSLICFN